MGLLYQLSTKVDQCDLFWRRQFTAALFHFEIQAFFFFFFALKAILKLQWQQLSVRFMHAPKSGLSKGSDNEGGGSHSWNKSLI